MKFYNTKKDGGQRPPPFLLDTQNFLVVIFRFLHVEIHVFRLDTASAYDANHGKDDGCRTYDCECDDGLILDVLKLFQHIDFLEVC